MIKIKRHRNHSAARNMHHDLNFFHLYVESATVIILIAMSKICTSYVKNVRFIPALTVNSNKPLRGTKKQNFDLSSNNSTVQDNKVLQLLKIYL